MKRVAIPIAQGKLSPLFGQCNHYEIFDIEDQEVLRDSIEIPPGKTLPELPEWAASQGITDVIVHKVDKQIIQLFSAFKINLFVGIPMKAPREIIHDYLEGNLKSNSQVITEIIN